MNVGLAGRPGQPDLTGPVRRGVGRERPGGDSPASGAVAEAVSSGCSSPRSPANAQQPRALRDTLPRLGLWLDTSEFTVEETVDRILTATDGEAVGVLWTASSGLASRGAGIWVVGRELLGGAVVDESLVKQPLDGPALGSNITQGMPRRNQFGVVFIELVLESSERSPPLQRLCQASAGRAVADAVSKVGHVLIPHVGRERVDENEIQLVDLDGVLPVDARVAGPERHPARLRVDQPSVLVVSLTRIRR